MISLTSLVVAGPSSLLLTFSDGSQGQWSAEDLLARDTVLTRALIEPDFFARAFIEGGHGLAWPNGLELSADALHRRMSDQGLLQRRAA